MLGQKEIEKCIDNLINHITDTEEIDVALGHLFKDLETNRASCLPQLVSYTWQKISPEQNVIALIHFMKQISVCPQPNTMARYFEVVDHLMKSQICPTKTIVDALLKCDCLHMMKPLFMECAYQVIVGVLPKLDYKTNREVLSKSLELSLVLPAKLNSTLSRRLAAYVKVMTHLLSHDGQFMPVYFTMYELNKLFTRDKAMPFGSSSLQFQSSSDRRIHPLFSRQIKLMFDAFWAPAVLFSVPFHFQFTAIPGVTSLSNHHFRLDATTLHYNFQGAMPAPEHLLGVKSDVTIRLGCLPRSSDLLEVYIYNPSFGKEVGRYAGMTKTFVNLTVQAARFMEDAHARLICQADAEEQVNCLHLWAREFFDHLQCLAFRLINYRIFVRTNDFISGLAKSLSEHSGNWIHSRGYLCWFLFNMISAFLPTNKLSDFVTCVEVLDHICPLFKIPLSVDKVVANSDAIVKAELNSESSDPPPIKRLKSSPTSSVVASSSPPPEEVEMDDFSRDMYDFIDKIELQSWSDGSLHDSLQASSDFWKETHLFSIVGVWMLLIEKNPPSDASSEHSAGAAGQNVAEYLPRPMPPFIARIHHAVDKHLQKVIDLCSIAVAPNNSPVVGALDGPSELMKKVSDSDEALAKLELLFSPRGTALKRMIILMNSISSNIEKLSPITTVFTNILWNGLSSRNQELRQQWKCGFQMEHNLSGSGVEEPIAMETLQHATLHLKMQLELALLNKFNKSGNMVPPPGVVETMARLLCQYEAEEKLLLKLENFLVADKIGNFGPPGGGGDASTPSTFTFKDPVSFHTMLDILAFRVSHLLSPLRKMQSVKMLYALHKKTLSSGMTYNNPCKMQLFCFVDAAIVKLMSRISTSDDIHNGWLNTNITASLCTSNLMSASSAASSHGSAGPGTLGGGPGVGLAAAMSALSPGTIAQAWTAQSLVTESPELNRFALMHIGLLYLTYDLDELQSACKWLQDLLKLIARATPSACVMSESNFQLFPRMLHDELQTHSKNSSLPRGASPSNNLMEDGTNNAAAMSSVGSSLLFLGANTTVRQNSIAQMNDLDARWNNRESAVDNRLINEMVYKKMYFCVLWKHIADQSNSLIYTCIIFLEHMSKSSYDDQIRSLSEYIVAILANNENNANFLPQAAFKLNQLIGEFHLFSLEKFILMTMSLPLTDERFVAISHRLIIYLLTNSDALLNAASVLAQHQFVVNDVFPDNWHQILRQLHQVWPDHSPIHKIWLQQDSNHPMQFNSSTCRYLPVYYGHAAQRLLPILEQFYLRLLVHKTPYENVAQLGQVAAFLFRFHGSPLTFVYSTLKFLPLTNLNLNSLKRCLVLPIIDVRFHDSFGDFSEELKSLLDMEGGAGGGAPAGMSPEFYRNLLSRIVKANRGNIVSCSDPSVVTDAVVDPSDWPNMQEFYLLVKGWRNSTQCNAVARAIYLGAVELMLLLTADVDVNQIVSGLYDTLLEFPPEVLSDTRTSVVIDYANALALLISVCPAVFHQAVYRRFHYLLSDECVHACLPRENLVDNLVSHIVPNLQPREHRWSREIGVWHAYWVHANTAALMHMKDVVSNHFTNQVMDEAKFILVLSLVGPHSLRLNKEATNVHTDLTVVLYQMLVQVDGLSRLLFMDVIVDCLYHLKYMYVGNGPIHRIKDLIPKLRPALQEKLKFILPRP